MRRGYLSLGIKDIFSPKGRIDRLTYFIYGAILAIMSVILKGALLGLALTLGETIEPYISDYTALAGALLVLPLLYGQFCIFAKRLHDLNLPAILAILLFSDLIFQIAFSFVPEPGELNLSRMTIMTIGSVLVIGMFIGHLLLLFVPGTRGPNRYGSNNLGDPLPKARILEG